MSDSHAHHGAADADDALPAVGWSASFLSVVALILAAALGALMFVTSGWGESLHLTVTAVLAAVGVFFLFGMVTARLQTAARMSEADLIQAVSDTLGDGIQITARGRLLYANRAFGELIGLTDFGEPKQLGEAFAGEPQAAEALFRLARAIERGECRQEEFELGSQAGGGRQQRWYRLSVRPLRTTGGDADLKPLALWVVSDISAEPMSEVAARRVLEESLAQYEGLPLGLMVVAEDGRIERMNAALMRFLRIGSETRVRTLKVTDILSIDGAALLKSESARAHSTPVRIDLDFVREDGTSWPASVVGVARTGGGDRSAFVAAVLDRVVDTGSRSTRTRFAPLVKSAPFGIATIDRDGGIVSANPAFARLLLDGTAVDARRMVESLGQRIDADARTAFGSSLDAALSGKANILPVEVTLGENRMLTRRIYLSPLMPSKGAREAAILYVIDTTEQKSLEQKFAQSQKMEAVGKLAGGIAHDFNNVLTAVIGFSDLLLQTHRPVDPAYKNIRAIKSSANRAAGMVNQLLAFSRRQTLQPEVLQLGEVLTDLS